MKTTIEIPDRVFRRAKASAAERGQSLKELVTEALQEKLAAGAAPASGAEPVFMAGFGKLRHLHAESRRIQRRIERAFEVLEPEDRS